MFVSDFYFLLLVVLLVCDGVVCDCLCDVFGYVGVCLVFEGDFNILEL